MNTQDKEAFIEWLGSLASDKDVYILSAKAGFKAACEYKDKQWQEFIDAAIADRAFFEKQIAAVMKERDELAFYLRYIEAQTHLGHIHDTANAALAKVGADKTGDM